MERVIEEVDVFDVPLVVHSGRRRRAAVRQRVGERAQGVLGDGGAVALATTSVGAATSRNLFFGMPLHTSSKTRTAVIRRIPSPVAMSSAAASAGSR